MLITNIQIHAMLIYVLATLITSLTAANIFCQG